MANKPEYLSGLEPVSAAQWKLVLQSSLKGGDYNSLLTSEIFEGIRIKPFYNREDLEGIRTGIATEKSSWKIGSFIDSDGNNASFQDSNDWDAGVDTWIISIEEARNTWPSWIMERREWPSEVHLEIPNPFDFPFENRPISLAHKTKILLDPIGRFAASGNWVYSEREDLEHLAQVAHKIETCKMNPVLLVSGEIFQQAGANAVQEIAYSLALAHEYLLFKSQNPDKFSWIETPVFRLALGGEYFSDIAKIQALRKGWNLLAGMHNLPGHCKIHVQPSLRNKTCYDYNTNMLRTTLECMAGIFGGADLICNVPYDKIFSPPNAFAERLAINQLLIMRHESGFGHVLNPADGSFFIESLTDQLGRKALELFKSLEAGGGFLDQLKKHTIQKKIRQHAQREQDAFDKGHTILVGSNKFSNPGDKITDPEFGNTFPKTGKRTKIEPLKLRRLAHMYELKRKEYESR